jgi:hypothetical protein
MIDFCVPGFSKCGTTTLCDMLNSHTEIFIPPLKEPGYFAENFGRGRNWYLGLFDERKRERLTGDGSTTYSSLEFADVASDRILAESPDCKFILIARDPRARLESSFREMHANAYKYGILPDFDFSAALRQLPNMISDTLYWKLINIFRAKIPDSQIHVLFLEDLSRQPALAYQACLKFLGVPSEPLMIREHRLNAASTKMCDTKLMRWIWTNPYASRWWNCFSLRQQEKLMRCLRLRKRFTAEIEWDAQAQAVFDRVVKPDSRKFLTHFGKTPDFWSIQSPESCEAARAA